MRAVELMNRFEFDHFKRVGAVIEREARRVQCKDSTKTAYVVRSGDGYFMGAVDSIAICVTADATAARRFETEADACDCVCAMGRAGFVGRVVEVLLATHAETS